MITKFRFNKSTLLSLGIILFYCIAAIFCYVFSIDKTQDVNSQIPELALHRPFTEMKFICIQNLNKDFESSFLKKLIFGSKNQEQLIPILTVRKNEAGLTGVRYMGKNQFTNENLPTENFQLYYSKELLNKKFEIVTKTFPFGTDAFGRCIYSRILVGSRVSLSVGIIAVCISLSIGILIGLLGGYFGGKVDALLMLFVNTIWSIPTLLLVFAIVLALGRGMHILYLAIGFTLWVDVARIVRGQVMSAKNNVYVDAAKSLGFKNHRIMFRHILPNILAPIFVIAAGNFATAIILEAGLSYLGFGVQPPLPSWGNMLNENYGYALSGHYYLALIPAVTIVILVLNINIVGNNLRDYFDVKIDK